MFENANGRVTLSSAYRLSGYHSVEITDVAGDGDFPELQGFLPLIEHGRVSTTPDRIIAADNIATNLTGVLALFAIQTGEKVVIIAVVALTILSFVATAVYAKFLERGQIIE